MGVVEALRHPRKIFLGWWMMLATGVMAAWGYGTWLYSYGLYFEPLQQEFGWTRAEISAAAALRRLEGGLEGPFGGIFTDKYGPRVVNFLGFVIAGLGFILLYFVNSLWSFLLVWGFIVSLGLNLGMWGPMGKALADWFVKKRGLVHSIARTIQTIGNSIIPTFMLVLMIAYGWRMASLIAGLMTWAIALPLTWFFTRPHRPEYYGMLPDGAEVDEKLKKDQEALIRAGQEYTAKEMEETEFTLRQAMRTRAFWIPLIASAPMRLAGPFFTLHFIPYLTDMGIDPMAATAALGFMTFISIPGRLAGGTISDRIPLNRLKWIRILSSVMEWTGLLILMNAKQLWMVYLYAVLRGPAMGLSSSSTMPIRVRYFGRKGYGTISGVRALLTIPVGVFAPIYVGWVYDVTGSYFLAMQQALILYIIGIFLWYFYDPPKRTTVVTEVKRFL